VSVIKGGVEIAQVSEPGVIFGELSALLDQPHTADVHTVETSQFHVADAAALLGQDPVTLLFIATALARRLNDANLAFLVLKNQLEAGDPPGLIDKTVERIEGLLSAIGAGYVRAGAGYTIFPTPDPRGQSARACKRRSKNPSLEAAEWFGCAGVKIRQPRSLCLIRARARDEGRGTIRQGTTCGPD
jgi:hypothetical protein